MQMLNECGRGIMQGGSRRSAIWAGLRWDHPDILKFIHIKDWTDAVRQLQKLDFNFPATLDCTNISVGLNDEFFAAYRSVEHPKHALAHVVYWATIKQRTYDFFEAYYAEDFMAVAGFMEKYGVNFMVVERGHFDERYLSRGKVYFRPFRDEVRRQLEAKKKPFALMRIPQEKMVYQSEKYFVVDLKTLRSLAEGQGRALHKGVG